MQLSPLHTPSHLQNSISTNSFSFTICWKLSCVTTNTFSSTSTSAALTSRKPTRASNRETERMVTHSIPPTETFTDWREYGGLVLLRINCFLLPSGLPLIFKQCLLLQECNYPRTDKLSLQFYLVSPFHYLETVLHLLPNCNFSTHCHGHLIKYS